MTRRFFSLFFFVFLVLSISSADVVINELNYDPIDIVDESGSLREFIELYNPGPSVINLSDYAFTNGISYTFPFGSSLNPDSYLVIARFPTHSSWDNQPFTIYGPFEGKLSNDGERLRLQRADGTTADKLTYKSEFPWSESANGYGHTLERIAWDLPSNDYHSWRTSLNFEGTPGKKNSVENSLPRPMIQSATIKPEHPTSFEPVLLSLTVDAPAIIADAVLQWETHQNRTSTHHLSKNSTWRYWKGTTAPSPNQQWTLNNFDDSTWLEGTSGFGYGDGGEIATPLNDMAWNYSTLYLRKKIDMDAFLEEDLLSLKMFYDDGFILYINGFEALRVNASLEYTHQSLATDRHTADEQETFLLGNARDFLHPGENIIALVGFNQHRDWSLNFVLEPQLDILTPQPTNRLPMIRVNQTAASVTLQAEIPPLESQTLVRCNLDITLTNGKTLRLPHQAERKPFLSYFVYDQEIPSLLPLMWIFDDTCSSLLESPTQHDALVVQMPDDTTPQLFDGLTIQDSRSGRKIKFLKTARFRGDRTLNLLPQSPILESTAGSTSPIREYFAYWLYQHLGVLTPRTEWFRVIEFPYQEEQRHTQRLVIQQINESLLEQNERDPDGDLYKYQAWFGFTKHTNKDEGHGSIHHLLDSLGETNAELLHSSIQTQLDVDAWIQYSAATMLVGAWDNFANNFWIYLNPDGLWEILPWDHDKSWGFDGLDRPPNVTLLPDHPITDPLPSLIMKPFHSDPDTHQQYLTELRHVVETYFTNDSILYQEIDEIEALLKNDLVLLEAFDAQPHPERLQQINESFLAMRDFIEPRYQFLKETLPTSIREWALYE